MRQRLGQSTEPTLVHLREEVDKMISERAELLEGGAPGGAARARSALLRRLGLDAVRLPSPCLVFLGIALEKV